jgi:hypothetical protein
VVIVTAIVIWDYRRRAAKREVASSERFEQIFTPVAPIAGPAPAGGVAAAPEAPSPAAFTACERLLSAPETLIYYLLKTGIPDHEVFPKVPMAEVVEAPGAGYDREQQLRRLARHQVDFVICDKTTRVVVAILVQASGPEAAVSQRIKAECLKSAGIRMVTIDPASLPKRAELRAVVFGQAPQRSV